MKKFIGLFSILMLGLILISCGNENDAISTSENSNSNVTEKEYCDITGEYTKWDDKNIKITITNTKLIYNNYDKIIEFSYQRVSENIIYADLHYYLILNDAVLRLPDGFFIYV